MTKQVTVSELRRQLEILEKKGDGECLVYFRDDNLENWEIHQGFLMITNDEKLFLG